MSFACICLKTMIGKWISIKSTITKFMHAGEGWGKNWSTI